jgi:hypothetical protein
MFLRRKNRKFATHALGRIVCSLLALAGLVVIVGPLAGCQVEWGNNRLIYVRNHTTADALLTWTIPCTQPLCQGQWPSGYGVELGIVEPQGTYVPRLVVHGTDTLLANYMPPVPLRVQRLSGDSVAVTITVAAGTSFVVADYTEAYQHSSTDGVQVRDYTFLPGTVRWWNSVGKVCCRRFQPRVWRRAQDAEAEQKYTKTYTLEHYIDLY